MNETAMITKTSEISFEQAGKRLDYALKMLFPEYSRARLQAWLETGDILVEGQKRSQKELVKGGERVILTVALTPTADWGPEDLPLDLIYDDEHLLVINKPTNSVVHPGAGNLTGTLVNALLHRFPELSALPRAGIVHRLDKDTTGLLVVAKTHEAHIKLVEALEARRVTRSYDALVWGSVISGGRIEARIGRHPQNRQKMAVINSGRHAVSHYRIREKFKVNTWLEVNLETGRTHQIRVHLAHIHHPVLGDPVYGGKKILSSRIGFDARQRINDFSRQALHAKKLSFLHPITSEALNFEAPLPSDFQELLECLRKEAASL